MDSLQNKIQKEFRQEINHLMEEVPEYNEYLQYMKEQYKIQEEHPSDNYAHLLFSPVFPNAPQYLQQMALLGRLKEGEHNLRKLFQRYEKEFWKAARGEEN